MPSPAGPADEPRQPGTDGQDGRAQHDQPTGTQASHAMRLSVEVFTVELPNRSRGERDERTSGLGAPARLVPASRGWLVQGDMAQRIDDAPIRIAAGLHRPAQRRNGNPVPAHARPAIGVAYRAQRRSMALPLRRPTAATGRTRTGS